MEFEFLQVCSQISQNSSLQLLLDPFRCQSDHRSLFSVSNSSWIYFSLLFLYYWWFSGIFLGMSNVRGIENAFTINSALLFGLKNVYTTPFFHKYSENVPLKYIYYGRTSSKCRMRYLLIGKKKIISENYELLRNYRDWLILTMKWPIFLPFC